MRNYTTQMDAARKGIVTPELEVVARKENMTNEALMKLVAEGRLPSVPTRISPVLIRKVSEACSVPRSM